MYKDGYHKRRLSRRTQQFPYTTLFRSIRKKSETEEKWLEQIQRVQGDVWQALRIGELQRIYTNAKEALPEKARALLDPRSEEHTSELQSHHDLVCRLLLEKKKTK